MHLEMNTHTFTCTNYYKLLFNKLFLENIIFDLMVFNLHVLGKYFNALAINISIKFLNIC